MDLIITGGGSNRNQVLQVRIYIPDVEHWSKVNKIYADFFADHRPARYLQEICTTAA